MPQSVTLGRNVGSRFSTETISRYGRGRGIGNSTLSYNKCLCDRPHGHILCHACGYLGWGRLRYTCMQHPQTMFLIDMSQCPKCRAYAFMMTEF